MRPAAFRATAFLIPALFLSAQQSIPPEELRITSFPYFPPTQTLRSDVKLVEVLAVVRDGKGREVAGLTQGDFAVHDEGKKRELADFSVQEAPPRPEQAAVPAKTSADPVPQLVAGPAVPPEQAQPARSIALLLDDVNSTPADFIQVRDAALRFVKAGLAPRDRVGVFTESAFEVVPFTGDVARLSAAIARLNPHERRANTLECPNLTPYFAYLIANMLDQEVLTAKAGEYLACSPQAGAAPAVSGGRVKPASRNVNDFVNWQDPVALVLIGMSRQIWEEQEALSKDALGTIGRVTDILATQPGQRMLLLGSGGFLAGTLLPEQQFAIDRALHANVVINTLDAKGLYTADLPTSTPGGVNTRASTLAAKLATRPKDATNDVLENLAESTGGRFFHNDNDLAAGFARLAQIPEVSYLLGFAPPEPDGKYHRLKVEVPRGKGYSVQARRGYVSAKNSATPAEERKIDREVFTVEEASDAPVGVELSSVPSSSGGTTLRAVFHADLRTLPFLEQFGVRTEKLSFILALLGQDGHFVSGKEAAMAFALKPETFDRLRGTRLDADLKLDVPAPGAYRVRVLVEEANRGKMTEAVRPIEFK